jgi:Arc/MetJ-type ribon-helix-helix transcriptional regulator
MEELVGEDALYPSRSELIRVAVREYLKKQLRDAEFKVELKKPYDKKNYVRVPIERLDENSEIVQDFKEYKIVKRLDQYTAND